MLSDPPLKAPEAIRARLEFFDVWSHFFQNVYLGPIRDLCRRNGILSGGDFGGEDETTGSAAHG